MIYVVNNYWEVNHHFPVKGDRDGRTCLAMIVDSMRKVVITCRRFIKSEGCVLDVYENDGQFVRRFGEGLLRSAKDLALAGDDRVIVLDEDCDVHMFSEHGDHLSEFKLSFHFSLPHRIAFHLSSEHFVIVADQDIYVYFHIHTKDGELVRSTKTRVKGIDSFRRILVTGHVSLPCEKPGRVFILC